MLFIHLDWQADLTLGDQIEAGIRSAISTGELAPSEKLPPAKELAAGLGVNVHTVLSSFARLRQAGLLEMRQGRGTRVHPEARPTPQHVLDLARRLIEEATGAGMSRSDLKQLIERIS